MSLEGARNRSGGNAGLMLLGLGLYTVMMAYLLRIPCRVPDWNMAQQVPELCATVIGTGDLSVRSVSYTHLTLPTIYSV